MIATFFGVSVIALYFIVSIFIAWRARKFAAKSLADYAVGYTSIGTPVLVAGLLGSSIGAGTIIGSTGELFSLGLLYAAQRVMMITSWWVASKTFPRNLAAIKAAGCLSISHVMHHFYGDMARWITTILTLLSEVIVITAQMTAISYTLSNLLSIPSNVAAVIALLMIMGFSLMGGIRTIAQTGMFQFGLFFLLFPVSYLLISHQYGGFQGLNKILPVATWGAGSKEVSLSAVMLLMFFGFLPDCSSSFIQKCLIARNKKQLETSLKLVGQIYLPIMLSLCFVAYTVRTIAPGIAPEQTIFYYINNMCPFWMKGVLSVSLIAIIMGMSDGILHATSVIVANDVVKVLRPQTSEAALLRWARLSIVIISCAAFALISSVDIVDINGIMAVLSIWIPIVAVPIYAAFGGFVTDKKAFISSTLASAVAISLCYYAGFASMEVIFLATFASFIGFFGWHLFFKIHSNPSIFSDYAAAFKKSINTFKKDVSTNINILKAKVIGGLFPKEDNMLVGQNLIYNKFCVCMIVLFFIYAMLMGEGVYYKTMGLLLGAGYVTATLFMLREVLGQNPKSSKEIFYVLWYSLLVIWATVSSYALIGGEDLVSSVATLSLLSLLVFTNATTYLFSIIIGFMISASIFLFAVGGAISHQFYLVGIMCVLVGYFFLHPQQELIKNKISELMMMLGTLAHEITSPQAAALMSMEMVITILADTVKAKLKNGQVSLTFDEESLKMLETFSANALKKTKDGIKIVRMLLMIVKTDKVELPKKIFNVNKCAQKAISEYTDTNKAVAGQIKLDIDSAWQINGTEDFVEQVIHNIVKNSFIHGGKNTNLAVQVYNEGNKLIIEDNGVGIPTEHLPFIFDRFFTKSNSGTGIGLALSKMVAESMGGAITCESQTGEGSFTRFVITIPPISDVA